MLRIILLVSALAVSAALLACGGANSNNANIILVNSSANNAVAPNVATNANDMVPGSPTVSVTPATNTTPGIPPANAITPPKGATPTPGIPAPGNVNKPMKPGATPTPGIPDQETIRRQMQGLEPNMNVPPKGEIQMRPTKRSLNKPANNQ